MASQFGEFNLANRKLRIVTHFFVRKRTSYKFYTIKRIVLRSLCGMKLSVVHFID